LVYYERPGVAGKVEADGESENLDEERPPETIILINETTRVFQQPAEPNTPAGWFAPSALGEQP
jgi:hypothetical protein